MYLAYPSLDGIQVTLDSDKVLITTRSGDLAHARDLSQADSIRLSNDHLDDTLAGVLKGAKMLAEESVVEAYFLTREGFIGFSNMNPRSARSWEEMHRDALEALAVASHEYANHPDFLPGFVRFCAKMSIQDSFKRMSRFSYGQALQEKHEKAVVDDLVSSGSEVLFNSTYMRNQRPNFLAKEIMRVFPAKRGNLHVLPPAVHMALCTAVPAAGSMEHFEVTEPLSPSEFETMSVLYEESTPGSEFNELSKAVAAARTV